MSAITAKASRKMKKYAVLTREPRCFLGSFDFSWEQRKFSDITFPAGEKNKDNLPLESYSITNEHGFVPQDEKFENGGTMREADKRMYYIVSPNSFAYNPARINVGSIGYQNIGKNVIVSSLYEVFKTSEDVDDRLLWHWFKSPDFQKLIMQLQEGGVRLYFYYDKLCMGEVSLPLLEEQRKIGKLFDTLDNLITLHQRKCALLFSSFQALISMMFTTSTFSWEQRKAIDIADYSKGNGYSKGDLTDSGTPIILYGRLYTKYQFAISEVDTFAVPRNGAVYSQGNEVIVPASGETAEDIARASAVEESGVLLGGDLNILRPFDFINPLFLALAISNGEPQKELAKKAQGKSVVHIHNTDIQEVTIAYPSRTEQDRIVSVFRQLDNLITLHQRKCISFTVRAGRLISTVNKKRITSSWEQRKVSDLAEKTYGGGTPTTSNEAYWNGDIPWIQSSDVVDGKLLGVEPRKWITQDGLNNSAAQLIPGNSIAIITRVGVGKLAFMPYSYATSQDFLSLSKLNAEPLFTVYACYKKLQSELNAVQGTSIKGITKDELLAKNIMVPRYAEQQQIGAFFKQLDHLITLHQRQPIVYAVIHSIRKANLVERQYFAPPMVRKFLCSLSANNLQYYSKGINAIVMQALGKTGVLWRRTAP